MKFIRVKKILKKLANGSFTFPKANTEDIKTIMNSLNPKNTTGLDGIFIKVIKTASKIADFHLTNVTNQDTDVKLSQ